MTTVPTHPQFPQFKPVELQDREVVRDHLWAYQPWTSELTFSNLFIWRGRYRFQWCLDNEWLLVLAEDVEGPYALEPVGPSPRGQVSQRLLRWLKEERGVGEPRIERADRRFASEVEGAGGFASRPVRDHFDYVYRSRDLVSLEGRKYHSKRNHVQKLLRSRSFSYVGLSEEHLAGCLRLAGEWCDWRNCLEEPGIRAECEATHEALTNVEALGVRGGVILVDGKVVAFALGEMLNDDTAVVHVEKADHEIPGLYAVINQQFCENQWREVAFVNREQDLGEEGLRKAKLSYHPVRLEEKYVVKFAGDGGKGGPR